LPRDWRDRWCDPAGRGHRRGSKPAGKQAPL